MNGMSSCCAPSATPGIDSSTISCRALQRVSQCATNLEWRLAYRSGDVTSSRVHDEGDNEAVQTQDFGKNEDKDLGRTCKHDTFIIQHKALTMPTKSRGCWAVPRTPASPTMPIAKPAARPARPTERPAPSCTKPWNRVMCIDTAMKV